MYKYPANSTYKSKEGLKHNAQTKGRMEENVDGGRGRKKGRFERHLNATKIHSKMETNQGNDEKAYRANVQTRKRLNALK